MRWSPLGYLSLWVLQAECTETEQKEVGERIIDKVRTDKIHACIHLFMHAWHGMPSFCKA